MEPDDFKTPSNPSHSVIFLNWYEGTDQETVLKATASVLSTTRGGRCNGSGGTAGNQGLC